MSVEWDTDQKQRHAVYQTLGSQSHASSVKLEQGFKTEVYEHCCNKTELDGKGLIVCVCIASWTVMG